MSGFRRRLMAAAQGGSAPVTKDYLKFTIRSSGTITFTIGWHLTTTDLNYISYSNDNGASWTKLQNTDRTSSSAQIGNFNVTAGDVLLWKGDALRLGNGNSDYYAAKFGGSASYDVSGNIMSLLNEDFEALTSLTSSYQFCMLFSSANVVNAKYLILPSNTTNQCYFRMFYHKTTLVSAPVLPATWASTQCYYGMFDGASNINYIKALHTNDTGMNYWVRDVAAEGIFVKNINATWTTSGNNGVPSGWTIIYYDIAEDKYYIDQQKTQECDDHGNVINA